MSDLISRQAAIRWVKTECNKYGKPTIDFESGKKVIEHLEQMPSAERWIPVSEGLPRYDETSEYLVTDKDGRVRHCCLDPYMPETFVTVEEGMIVDAVAWRPAPEPYCKTESHEREVE